MSAPKARQPKLKINRRLLWNVDLSKVDLASEAFLRHYVARVLSHGTAEETFDKLAFR